MPLTIAEFDPPFDVLEPVDHTTPLVFNSPHSGRVYPASFIAASRLDGQTLRRSEDFFVDELFAGVVARGAPLMRAHFPRAYLDVNREPYELDPRMFEGRLPAFANTRSLRVAGGLGTVARVVGDAKDIYPGRIPVEDALLRIALLYKPYHQTLHDLLHRTLRRFGMVLLVDCHSMPSSLNGRDEPSRADFVLGDRYGSSAGAIFMDTLDHALRSRGYAVTRNKPYAGGFITEHYGNPATGVHAIQIEVNRGLYMDESRLRRLDALDALTLCLTAAMAELADIADAAAGQGRLAAE